METVTINKKLLSLIEEAANRQNITPQVYVDNVLYYAVQNHWKVIPTYQVWSEEDLIQIAEESFEESVNDYDEALENLAK